MTAEVSVNVLVDFTEFETRALGGLCPTALVP